MTRKAKIGPSELRTQYTIIFQRLEVIAFSALTNSLIFIEKKALVELFINSWAIFDQNLDPPIPWKFWATHPNSWQGLVDVNFVLRDSNGNVDKKSVLWAQGTTLPIDSNMLWKSVFQATIWHPEFLPAPKRMRRRERKNRRPLISRNRVDLTENRKAQWYTVAYQGRHLFQIFMKLFTNIP